MNYRENNKKYYAALCMVMFFIQSCASTHYAITSSKPKRNKNDIPPNSTFSVGLDKESFSGPDFDKVYLGIVSEFSRKGIVPTGPDGSTYDIQIQPRAVGERYSFINVISLSLGFMTLGIVPVSFPQDMEAEVKVKQENSESIVAQFSVGYRKSECLGMTPLAYLCVPNIGSLGARLGDQIAIRLANSGLPN